MAAPGSRAPGSLPCADDLAPESWAEDLRPQLPLFPLATVLFPQGLLPLRVFEARYVDLVAACLRRGEPFGVVALRQGNEVRQPGETVSFEPEGCLATILDCDCDQSGILQVRCSGQQRFALIGSAHAGRDGLWRADVQIQADDPSRPLEPDLQACADALERAIQALTQRNQHPFLAPYRLDDAGWVANRWSEILPIPLATRHKLMMLPDPVTRLRLIAGVLRRHRLLG
jgi:Lon protease-like protein